MQNTQHRASWRTALSNVLLSHSCHSLLLSGPLLNDLSPPQPRRHHCSKRPRLDTVFSCEYHPPLPLDVFWNLEVVIPMPINKGLFGSLEIKTELLF